MGEERRGKEEGREKVGWKGQVQKEGQVEQRMKGEMEELRHPLLQSLNITILHTVVITVQ